MVCRGIDAVLNVPLLRLSLGSCCAWLIFCGAAPHPAPAQQPAGSTFTVLPIQDGYRDGQEQYKRLKASKDRMVGGAPFNERDLQAWYWGYFFPSFTQEDELAQLPEKREELLNDLSRTSRDGMQQMRAYILQQTETFMKGFVSNQGGNSFHPAVRFNAMLILGQLNVREDPRVPNPDPAMFNFLVTEYRNSDQIDAVRVAAMLGILRHAKLDWARQSQRIPAADRDSLAQDLLALLEQRDPPQQRSVEGHVWMQRRAIDILAALGLVGQMENVNLAVNGIVTDEARPLTLRCTAAEALGLLNPQGQAKIDPVRTSWNLAVLAAVAGRDELDRMDAVLATRPPKPKTRTGGGFGAPAPPSQFDELFVDEGAGSGDMGSGGGQALFDMMVGNVPGANAATRGADAEGGDPELRLAQRRLLAKLLCIQTGLSGIANVTPAEQRRQVDRLGDRVAALVEAAREPPEDEPDLDGLARTVRRAVREIESITKSLQPAVAPPQAAGGPGNAAPPAAPDPGPRPTGS